MNVNKKRRIVKEDLDLDKIGGGENYISIPLKSPADVFDGIIEHEEVCLIATNEGKTELFRECYSDYGREWSELISIELTELERCMLCSLMLEEIEPIKADETMKAIS